MSELDIKSILKGSLEEIPKETEKVLIKHKTLINNLTKQELAQLCASVLGDDEADFDALIYSMALRGLSNVEFLKLRQKNIDSAKQWALINVKKKELYKDMKSILTKEVSKILIQGVLLAI